MVNSNLNQTVNLDNRDELGQVAISFNEIASALLKTRAELEQKVEERTAELSRTNERLNAEIAERQQAEKTLNRYAGRLEVLHKIDRAILAAHSPQEIARTALGHLRQLVPCQRAGLTLLNFESNEAVILAVDAENETQLKAGGCFPFTRNQ
jgi:nitrate/nitrite-specific signal transduction histidine kinase